MAIPTIFISLFAPLPNNGIQKYIIEFPGRLLIAIFVGKLLSWILARILIKLNFLPNGAERTYPNGESWNSYDTLRNDDHGK
jgi:NhaP-type Na+/H+ or K+/H+ antiporter